MKAHRTIEKAALAALALSVGLLLAACGETAATKDDHGARHDAVSAAHRDEGGEQMTHFTEQSELFLEFAPLVAGQATTLAAHVSRLADFKPLDKGRLTVLLSGGGAPDERFTVDAPVAPGIFKPEITPKAAGEREMTLIVECELGTLTHELGPVGVFADIHAARNAHDEHGHDEKGIPFSKEQQWKIDFATVEAVKGIARASVAASGTIRAPADAEARLVAPAAGVLRSTGVFPRIGQAVRKGQVLAMLAPRLGGEVDQATLAAGADKARIALELAKRERERMAALFKDEAIPERRWLEAQANERIASAEFAAAQARAAQLGNDGTGIAIRAPIDGTIADVSVVAGSFVAEGAPLLHVANTAKLWLEARVAESEIARLALPAGAAFAVEGFEPTFVIEPGKNGKLLAVGTLVDPATRTVPVIFEFANPGNALRLGMAARVQLLAGGGRESVLLPASALQDENGTQVVYVQTGGESFERRIVQTGLRDGERIAVVDGLEPGQRVVSKGAYLIRLSTSKAGPAGHAH